MKLVGLMPVRNEDWILEASIDAALQWCDSLVILLHFCIDESLHIVRDARARYGSDRIHFVQRFDYEWQEMEHRQELLKLGRAQGGTHFALVDADEILTANALTDIRPEVASLAPGHCLDVPMIPVWGDLMHYRIDPCVWTRAWLTVAFADAPGLTWKPREDGYQHHHRAPFGAVKPADRSLCESLQRQAGGVMHLQFAVPRRLRAKHALYKMQEVLRWPGREPVGAVDAKYSQALDEAGLVRVDILDCWWDGYKVDEIKTRRLPWQEAECKRLMAEHGRERFQGLELWGVAESS